MCPFVISLSNKFESPFVVHGKYFIWDCEGSFFRTTYLPLILDQHFP